jgi:hypothetical protein
MYHRLRGYDLSPPNSQMSDVSERALPPLFY